MPTPAARASSTWRVGATRWCASPFRWERVQPTLGGPLNLTELSRINQAVTDAGSAGLKVVLNCHNFGMYKFSDATYGISTARVTISNFANLWRRLSLVFDDAGAVRGYDLMNEPMQMPGKAQTSEAASQAALTAIRSTGDGTRVRVDGYHTNPDIAENGVFTFVANHPSAWIGDPPRTSSTTTHGYWGHYGYEWIYGGSNAYWQQRGY